MTLGLIILSIIKISVAIAITILVNKLSFFKSSDNSSKNNNLKAKGKKMIIWGVWLHLIYVVPYVVRYVADRITGFRFSFGIVWDILSSLFNVISYMGLALLVAGIIMCIIYKKNTTKKEQKEKENSSNNVKNILD